MPLYPESPCNRCSVLPDLIMIRGISLPIPYTSFIDVFKSSFSLATPHPKVLTLFMPTNPLYTFPRSLTLPWTGKLPTCFQLVGNICRCNGIWETPRNNRHNELLPAPTCYRRVADWSSTLRTCCRLVTGKAPTC